MLRRRGIETVILAGADTHGIMRGERLPWHDHTALLHLSLRDGTSSTMRHFTGGLLAAMAAGPVTDRETSRYPEAL